ncbi:MAG: class I SAM-dependent methyltransferase, partial [Nanoarchaeota archaeon]|nr:class I SAM-dependent methyltransferase [Nanoarchaeota archaeon]
MTKKQLKKAYNEAAKDFLISRTQANVDTGIYNREIEQPTMFKLVQKNLKNKKLLDAACGPGIHLKEYVKRGAKGFGIDLTPNMIKLAKEYCKGAKFEVGTIEKLKFKDASFDIVTCSLALDHIKDLNKAIKQINRVLK